MNSTCLYRSYSILRLFILQLSNREGDRGGGAVGQSIRLASGRLGVGIPAATDLSHKNR